MQVVEFTTVQKLPVEPRELHGFYLDYPQQGYRTEARGVDFQGWVLGRDIPVAAVEIVQECRVLRRVVLDRLRPDVAAEFPDVPEAGRCGFYVTIPMLGIR